jgi:hypothetical protein
MDKIKTEGKHCNTCRHSYQAVSFSNKPLGQHCKSPDYNSPDYTRQMLDEDWGKGYCRFYEPKEGETDEQE